MSEELKEIKFEDAAKEEDRKRIENFYKEHPEKTLKTLIFKTYSKGKEEFIALVIRGDLKIDLEKIKIDLQLTKIRLANKEEMEKLGLVMGYVSPIDCTSIKVIGDKSISENKNYYDGGNKFYLYRKNVNYPRDFKVLKMLDIKQIKKENKKIEETKQKELGREQLGMTVKKKDFNEWYLELVQKSDMADYACVDGFIIFKPYAYAIWEMFQKVVDEKLKEMGIRNVYFPVLIPEHLLKKEATHFEGFTPEVAWVTHAGETKLGERLAVRPTSEAIMYDSYSKWIRSWRDLPLRLNQWNAVLRWEFKHAKPFLRTREFLWNEGHTVFATQEEAEKECKEILEMYDWFCKEYLALAGTKGRKTEKEKFAGAVYSEAIELMMPDGKVIQGPIAHFDGQNFAKAFDIKFIDKNEKEQYAFQNTWAITTRMIGVLIANHSDDKGLVLPPMIAPIQIVIVPIYKEETRETVLKAGREIEKKLSRFRVKLDDRDQYTPGFKFNEWELKGVPLRIEIGPRDLEKKQAVIFRRDICEKMDVKISELEETAEKALLDIQKNLYNRSLKFIEEHTKKAKTYEELKKGLEGKRVLACWCEGRECEDKIKEETTAKISCLPLEQELFSNKCVYCGKPAKKAAIFARSY